MINNNISLNSDQSNRSIIQLEEEYGIRITAKLQNNENVFGPSPHAICAAQSCLADMHLYPDDAYLALKMALAVHLNVNADQVVLGNGSENVLELIIRTFLKPNTNAVLSEYSFLTIPLLINSYGAKANVVPTQQFQHDIAALHRAIDKNTSLLFLVNPNNPTGTYTNTTDFIELMQHVPAHVMVVVDEAYVEYIHELDFPDTISLLKHYPNLIITRTFSKAYGLAAMRVGYAITHAAIAHQINYQRLPYNVNAIALSAALAALKDQAHLRKTVAETVKQRQHLAQSYQSLGIPFIQSVTNFICIQHQQASLLYTQLLNAGILTRPLLAYALPNYLRITVGKPEQNTHLLQVLESIV